MQTVSFKEVHEELEKEAIFLNQNHDIKDFQKKADFLNTVGFKQSIATKLYGAIAEKSQIIRGYEERYQGKYKFLLEPQLERLCEKYNLFVRDADFFLADIPEQNIKEMMDFKLNIRDLHPDKEKIANELFKKPQIMTVGMRGLEEGIWLTLAELGELDKFINDKFRFSKYSGSLQIAAVSEMFSPVAFQESTSRIIQHRVEAVAKNQVDTDPIVLYRTKDGWIVITAWGDEGNDELVLRNK